jgi:alkylation response protein AidB-like acyl-CoA dehydrogenase
LFCARSIRGGSQGERVERLYREVRAYAIPGGSEEILLDLGIRQAMKAAVTARAKM